MTDQVVGTSATGPQGAAPEAPTPGHSGEPGRAPALAEPETGQLRGRIARDEILTAAIECLLENGYSATTTMKVQQRAGVSRGKLLHHFPSKRELITASIRRLAADRLDTSTTDHSTAPHHTLIPERVRWSLATLWETFFHPNFWAAMETWIAARTDPELAAELIAHEKQVLRRVRQNAHVLFGPTITGRPQFARMLDVIFTSMRGMAITYTFSGKNPDTEPMLDTWAATALALLASEPAATEPTATGSSSGAPSALDAPSKRNDPTPASERDSHGS